ncbi:nucleotide sugar dehydrogenase [Psychroserpens sp.]|uniref:nucleotide sugar dehydrogenase n=1 Tax=Psychroserpens sp. TaxID=2020870 RepID=UPI001B19EC78|nr:nucleotide sugar dehydrogenase [Psychroserpens sp.]MBO6606944.1 nucleotide sugar dehydrogenase [Psychroserpens sp.]MBO6654090.1 nucleotide sugar dehydrogenase [Psychroserpens sp.]MBO6682624.1 nucleotide sugar dehydrogenase [Psychroserpens sp.]MBO6750716.1 nucleotide sugar dehydrogenase [Psychroserpens sp.]MBO6915855.1 nucleotide sugar dehydrogenase [Psychroserpens sp.]
MNTTKKITILGLGYVGLPLAVEFAMKYLVVGFDINAQRIQELNSGIDKTLEVENDDLKSVLTSDVNATSGLLISDQLEAIADSEIYIVTVPTPTDALNKPIFTPLVKASESVGKVLKQGDIVIYESTVYPGVTEDICVPILESESGLTFNKDFFAGYSPERINPGDKKHTVTKILKVTSGSTPEIAKEVDDLYKSIITAGTHMAPSIKVAEAAKVIENSQRDINIAFVNELSKIFRLLDIDTKAVLEAAGTKWNFIKFTPGLVGGHCIGVDPYYLAQKAIESGYNPEIILAGRKMNDSMGGYVAQETVKMMIKKGARIKGSNVLVLGITFKENCPDIRNSRVIDIVREFETYNVNVDVYDPWASKDEVQHEYGFDLLDNTSQLRSDYDAIVLAVSHKEFLEIDLNELKSDIGVIFDVKSLLPKSSVDARL